MLTLTQHVGNVGKKGRERRSKYRDIMYDTRNDLNKPGSCDVQVQHQIRRQLGQTQVQLWT